MAGKQIYQRERERERVSPMVGDIFTVGLNVKMEERDRKGQQECINSQSSLGLKHLWEIAPAVCFSFWRMGVSTSFLEILKWLCEAVGMTEEKEACLAHKYT